MKNFEIVSLSPGLYLVSTPIGNLRDMTLRALDVLASVDMILCEDTRVSGKLLKSFGIEKKMISYNDHSAEKQRSSIISSLSGGAKVALISDAGMPLVSDPGFKLVRDCLDLGIFVTTLPGASAPLSALQLSGIASDKFSFLGFLPPKMIARQKLLEQWKEVKSTLIIFESGPRLVDCLEDLHRVLGNRSAAVVREITKLYEESRRDLLENLVVFYEEDGPPKGEIVIVVEGAASVKEYSDDELKVLLEEELSSKSVKDASSFVSEKTGVPRKRLYELALKIHKPSEA